MTSDISNEFPGMRGEGSDALEQPAPRPLRISGFLCLGLGLLSGLCLLGWPLLVVPITALVLGLVALRPAGGQIPVGTRPAQIGLVLAVGFGVCGFFLPWMKSQTLGSQASYFGRQYLQLVAQDEVEMVMELQRTHANRHLDSTPLKEFYLRNEEAAEALQRFRTEGPYEKVREAGKDADWKLERPVRIFHENGFAKADTRWFDTEGKLKDPIRVVLEYEIDPETGDGRWRVSRWHFYRDQ